MGDEKNDDPTSLPEAIEMHHLAPEVVEYPRSSLAPESIYDDPGPDAMLDERVESVPLVKDQNTMRRRRKRICGLTRLALGIVIAFVVAIVVGIGAGVGVYAHNKHKDSSSNGEVSSPTSSSHATATSTYASSATLSPDSFCTLDNSVVQNPTFKNLDDWTLMLDSDAATNFYSGKYPDGSDGTLRLDMLPSGESQSYYAAVYQQLNLTANGRYRVHMTYEFIQRAEPADDDSVNVILWLIFKQASNTTNELDTLLISDHTVSSNNTITPLTSLFNAFDDGTTIVFIYALSAIADTIIYTLSVAEADNNNCLGLI